MIQLNGMTYKIGSHGYVFMFVDGGWIKSDMTADEYHAYAKKQATEAMIGAL